jgi:hypothetical protein
MTRMYIDCFSGSLGKLPRGRRTVADALRALAEDPRVSVFERGPGWLESLIDDLKAQGLVAEDHAEPYPWCRFNLTDAGRAMLAPAATQEPTP